MDTKQFGQLDPKLKEVYERVMGTSAAPVQKPTPFVPKPSQDIPKQPAVAQTQTFNPQALQPAQPIVQAQPVQPQPQFMQKPQTQTPPTQNVKKKNNLMPVFIALGGFLFLIGYTFLWIKLFNLRLPFLP